MKQSDRIDTLLKLIKSEKNELPDRSGITPLFQRAIRFKKLQQTDSDKLEEIKTISRLTEYFDDFDSIDYINLFSYISTGILYDSALKEYLLTYLHRITKNKRQNVKNVKLEALKRINLIQFLQSIDESSIDENIILAQDIIQDNFPLNYAILLSSVSLKKGALLLKDLFSKKANYAIIYENRIKWLARFGKKAFRRYVLPLYHFLDDEEKRDLKAFCRDNGIPFTKEETSQLTARAKYNKYILRIPRDSSSTAPHRVKVHVTAGIPEFSLKAIARSKRNTNVLNQNRKRERKVTN